MDNNTPHITYQDDLSQRNLKKKSQPISLKKGTTISSGIARRSKIE
jgi:hypothetical protein